MQALCRNDTMEVMKDDGRKTEIFLGYLSRMYAETIHSYRGIPPHITDIFLLD